MYSCPASKGVSYAAALGGGDRPRPPRRSKHRGASFGSAFGRQIKQRHNGLKWQCRERRFLKSRRRCFDEKQRAQLQSCSITTRRAAKAGKINETPARPGGLEYQPFAVIPGWRSFWRRALSSRRMSVACVRLVNAARWMTWLTCGQGVQTNVGTRASSDNAGLAYPWGMQSQLADARGHGCKKT